MKYRIVLFALLLTSCSLDDGGTDFRLEVVPIESAVLPEEFVFGETHDIMVTYNRPSDCHAFNNFLFERDGNQNTIAVLSTVVNNTNCSNTASTAEVSFNFLVTSREPYTFRFYQGEDEQGNDTYLVVEVPVVE